jgi:hypothetical protein
MARSQISHSLKMTSGQAKSYDNIKTSRELMIAKVEPTVLNNFRLPVSNFKNYQLLKKKRFPIDYNIFYFSYISIF